MVQWKGIKAKLALGLVAFGLGASVAMSRRRQGGVRQAMLCGTGRVLVPAVGCGGAEANTLLHERDLCAWRAQALEQAIADARAKAALLGSSLRMCGVREVECRTERAGQNGEAGLWVICCVEVCFASRRGVTERIF